MNIQRPWRFNDAVSINESDALPGCAEKQNYSVSPVTAHIGVVLKCLNCSKFYDFSAAEQRYWYENLKFWIDSAPKYCFECRRKIRGIRNLNKKLCVLLSKSQLKDDDYEDLIDIAIKFNENMVSVGEKLGNKIRMAINRSTRTNKPLLRAMEILKK